MNDDQRSPLAVWEHNHREATRVLADFAETGDVDWNAVLTDQQAMLDDLLATQDRRLSRRRRGKRVR